MKGKRHLIIIFLGCILLLSSFIKNDTEPKEKFIVVLDAGHGGHDPGNIGNGYLEKNIALNVVLKVGEILEEDPNIEVIYTRKDDTFIDLFVRGEVANKANADLFVSVHCNAHNSDANGAETWVLSLSGNNKNMEVAKKENSVIYLEDNYEEKYSDYDINSPEFVIGSTIMQEEFLDQSIAIAKLVQDNFVKKLRRRDRKVKQAAFIVLHQTFMPSVLVELGFLTNKNEGNYLNSGKGQREMALAIANAVLTYKDGVDANLIELEPINNSPIPPLPKEEVVQASEETTKAPVEETKIPEQKKEVVVEKKEESPNPPSKSSIVFKVQIMASSKSIELSPSNFNGLKNVAKEPYKTMFRYMYGSADTYSLAKQLKAEADTKGYNSSYIVAYKNGERVPLNEALNSGSTQ